MRDFFKKIGIRYYNKKQKKYYAYILKDGIIRIGKIDHFSQTLAIIVKSIKRISFKNLLRKIKTEEIICG